MPGQLRWELDDAQNQQPALFARAERHIGRGEFRGMEFFHVRARSVINELKSGRGPSFLPFQYTINPYRGCSHACTYCFARPTHDYLGLGIGEDFERRIVVKINAVEVLRAELSPRRWAGHPIAMGTNTDPYQRCEGKYRLTQGIVGALTEAENPFSILTKSTLVLRDLDLLAEAARRTDVRVDLSIGTLDTDVWRLTEPGTPNPRRRLRAIEALNEAGITSGVLIGPIIPGLSDDPEQLDEVVGAVVRAGAASVGSVLLHLRPGIRSHFWAQLERDRPDLLERYAELYPEGRSYAPAAERKRIGGLVRDLVRRHGGPTAVRLTSDGDPDAPVDAPVASPRGRRPAAAHQLGLGL